MVLQGLVKFSRFSVQRCYTAERFGFDGTVLVLVGSGDRLAVQAQSFLCLSQVLIGGGEKNSLVSRTHQLTVFPIDIKFFGEILRLFFGSDTGVEES